MTRRAVQRQCRFSIRGRRLAPRHRTFSRVVAGLNCLHIPLGTVLGIFTSIVLGRESVGQLVEA